MGRLFSESFPEAKTDEDIELLQKKHPDYDRYYIASASIPRRRKLFEKLYSRFEPYADRHYLNEVKRRFHQRTWEMYLGCVLLEHNCKIFSLDKGPDIKIVHKDKVIWVECVACTKGEGVDAVPPLKYDGSLQDLPERQMLLRMTNSLDDKFKKYQEYLKKGIVQEEDVFIIALNRADLEHCDPGIPLILKTLFGVGYLNFPISSLRGENSGKQPYWSIRQNVAKQNGKNISVRFFEMPEHSGISAVIYSKENILNHPQKIGSECILIHNPLACNPLSCDTFSFFTHWEAKGGKIAICKDK